jgi:hypothetical protein
MWVALFIGVLIFFVSVWYVTTLVMDRYQAWKKEQYAIKHFRQTERFRRDFE